MVQISVMPRTFKAVSAYMHIIAFNIPYPADYGGAIDVFEKIKALHAEGAQIHLHCFSYNRPPAQELEQYCASVRYYLRKTGLRGLSASLPHIVYSRRDQSLLHNLSQDDYPILAEGMHSTFHLFKDPLGPALTQRWPERKVFIRTHNLEADYYRRLAENETSLLRKVYFQMESQRLKKWESKVAASGIPLLAITPADAAQYRYMGGNASWLPAFAHQGAGGGPDGQNNGGGPDGQNNGSRPEGTGDYILYHGDLSIKENEQALRWLLTEVHGKGVTSLAWIVAGRSPSKALKQWLQSQGKVRLESNPSEGRMEELIRNAHIHLIHSTNPSGIKIKLLHAVQKGRHVIVQKELLTGTGLEGTCEAAENAADYIQKIDRLSKIPFTAEQAVGRKETWKAHYDNGANARTLIQLL
jgi:hypothetical protein